MPDRAALVTGASSGIGYAIARMLGEEGHGLTVAARRPEKLADAAAQLRDAGAEHRNALVVNTSSISGVVPEIVFQRPGEALSGGTRKFLVLPTFGRSEGSDPPRGRRP